LIENETESESEERKNYSEVVPTNDYGTSYDDSMPKDKSDFWNKEFASEKTEQIKITQIEKMNIKHFAAEVQRIENFDGTIAEYFNSGSDIAFSDAQTVLANTVFDASIFTPDLLDKMVKHNWCIVFAIPSEHYTPYIKANYQKFMKKRL
jgi:hypothetical protein